MTQQSVRFSTSIQDAGTWYSYFKLFIYFLNFSKQELMMRFVWRMLKCWLFLMVYSIFLYWNHKYFELCKIVVHAFQLLHITLIHQIIQYNHNSHPQRHRTLIEIVVSPLEMHIWYMNLKSKNINNIQMRIKRYSPLSICIKATLSWIFKM